LRLPISDSATRICWLPIPGDDDRISAHFRAVVAYYPPYGHGTSVLTAPGLILINQHGDRTTADECRKLVAPDIRASGALCRSNASRSCPSVQPIVANGRKSSNF
jgi:hypothetical protein